MELIKHAVFITRRIPEIGIELLKPACRVTMFNYDDVISREKLKEEIRGTEGIICMLSEKMDQDIIDKAPGLKVISNFAVGFNNIDIAYATKKGIVVTNTPGVLTDATADLAWALLLAATRRLGEGEQMMRSGNFKGWGPLMLLGQDVREKTLGIIGAGRIGTAVAERSIGWNMNVLYVDNKRNLKLEKNLKARKVSLDRLFQESDFISLHVPLTPRTRHLVNENALKRMKPTAILVNTSRGPVVDEIALTHALQNKWIAGAALDVFEEEPALTPGLTSLNNVVLTPHLGSATIHTRDEMAKIAALNILAVLEGKQPPHPVNPEVLVKK